MPHYSKWENNPCHHGLCLYSSDSVSRYSFCCPKGFVSFSYTKGMRSIPLALVPKCLEGCHAKWSCCLWTRNQGPAQEMFSDCFLQCSCLLSLRDSTSKQSFPSFTDPNQLWSLALSTEFWERVLQNMKSRKYRWVAWLYKTL